jgi:hypothetical protein
MRHIILCGLLVSSWFISGLAMTGEPVQAARPNVCGVGILSPSGKVLFLPSASGGIEAVALFNGKTLWQSKGASRPLLATDTRVFAQAPIKDKRNQVKIVVLDAATGERLLESAVIPFPEWVSVRPDFGLRFRSGARLENKDLVFAWEARAFHDGGEPLPAFGPDGKPYVDPNAKKAGGALRINLTTGKLSAVKGYQPKEAHFPEDRPTWVGTTRAQGWKFRVEEAGPDPGFPYQLTTRILKAERADGKRSWEHRIAGEVFLPPRP